MAKKLLNPMKWGTEEPTQGVHYFFEEKKTLRSIPQEKISRNPSLDRNERKRAFLCGKLLAEEETHFEFIGHKVLKNKNNVKKYHFFLPK